MSIVIHTDIGGPHGLGHAVRMRALADTLQQRGQAVHFTTSSPDLPAFVAPFPCEVTPGPTCLAPEVLVIDTKAAGWATDQDCLATVRAQGIRLAQVDTPGATPNACDLLIAPVAHWEPGVVDRLRQAFGERFLYGWPYVMVRGSDPGVATPHEPYVLCCAGGSDPDQVMQRYVGWLRESPLDVPAVLALGSHAPLPAMGARGAMNRVVLTRFTPRLLHHAALVVTTFGVTAYECLAARVPALLLARHRADWDASLWLTLAAGHRVAPLGLVETMTAAHFRRGVHSILSNPRQGETMRLPLRELDGYGVGRVAAVLCSLATEGATA